MKKLLCILLVICCFMLPSCSNKAKKFSAYDYASSYGMAVILDGDAINYNHPSTYLAFKDIRECEFVATNHTTRLVNLLNYYFFDYPNSSNPQAKELFSDVDSEYNNKLDYIKELLVDYGITEDSRLTVDWIMENPEKAYYLFQNDTETRGFVYVMRDYTKENKDFLIFDTIFGLTLEEYKKYQEYYCVEKFEYFNNVDWDTRSKIVSNLNHYLWSDNYTNQNEEHQFIIKIAISYGLTEGDKISHYWVVKNPLEAYILMKALPDSVREEIFTIADEDEDE